MDDRLANPQKGSLLGSTNPGVYAVTSVTVDVERDSLSCAYGLVIQCYHVRMAKEGLFPFFIGVDPRSSLGA